MKTRCLWLLFFLSIAIAGFAEQQKNEIQPPDTDIDIQLPPPAVPDEIFINSSERPQLAASSIFGGKSAEALAFFFSNYAGLPRQKLPILNLMLLMEIPDTRFLWCDEKKCAAFWSQDAGHWQAIFRNEKFDLPDIPANPKSPIFLRFTDDPGLIFIANPGPPVVFTTRTASNELPDKTSTEQTTTIIITMSSAFYRKQAITKGPPTIPRGEDLFKKWKDQELSPFSPEHVELTTRLVAIARFAYELAYLEDSARRADLWHCGKEAIRSDETAHCAELIWNYELGRLKTWYDASDRLPYHYSKKRSKGIFEGKVGLAEVDAFLADGSGFKNYLQNVLPVAYPKNADAFKPFWNKK